MDELRKGPRKWHSKSRTGCHACKSRKVKCDEHRPSCRNCLRRAARCDFLDSEPSPSPGPGTPEAGWTSLDMELLHNFSVSTALTLASDPAVCELWRITVPQLGFQVRYILNGVLAVSALHMARSDIARQEMLQAKASECFAKSLEEALPLIPSVGKQNFDHMFVFAVLTLLINLASPKREDDMLLVGSIPQWLILLRGIIPLCEGREEAIASSSFSLIIRTSDFNQNVWDTQQPADDKNLDQLEAGLRSRTAGDVAKQRVLIQAALDLRRSYAFLRSSAYGLESKMRGFYSWLFEISEEFLALLKGADPDALCVFAFFIVLVREFERYWWAEGWSFHLIRRVYLVLGDEHRLYIRWPIAQIGWVPPSQVL